MPESTSRSLDWQADVLEFMRKFGQAVRETPGEVPLAVEELRERLHHEELGELHRAMMARDMPGVADGLADLIYVLLGTACAYGIDLRPIWAAVHAANMRKIGGGLDAGGKVMKPAGWQPPDVRGLLARQPVGFLGPFEPTPHWETHGCDTPSA